MHKKKCTRSAVLRSIDAALLLCFKRCKIEMKINDSRLSTRTHWCPLMAIERQIQMAPLECVTEGWFYRAAQRFVRSGASQWWMKQMMELSDFLWSSLTDWRHISVRKKYHWIKHFFLPVRLSLSDLHYYLRFAGFLAFMIDMCFVCFFSCSSGLWEMTLVPSSGSVRVRPVLSVTRCVFS